MTISVPNYVTKCVAKLENNGFEAYVVGGAVRDCIMGNTPSDWDIATNADVKTVGNLFPKHFDTGIKHGTVTVLSDGNAVEITTYRIDGIYSDSRHPEKVTFTDRIELDLSRRDFTVNAIAYNEKRGIVDPYGGINDIEKRIIRTVGNPDKRFNEDALRIMRCVRFSAKLDFEIEEKTFSSVKRNAFLLKNISAERIKHELDLFLLSQRKEKLLAKSGICDVILPELQRCFDVEQNNPHHCYNVGEHTFKALENAQGNLYVRYAVLLHDIGKTDTKTTDENGVDHFYSHSLRSYDMAREILNRLKMDNKTKDYVLTLIKCHDIRPEPNTKSLKRFLRKHPNIDFYDYTAVRKADVMGQDPSVLNKSLENISELQKAYEKIIFEKQPFLPKDLEIDGNDLKKIGFCGKEIGDIISMLLDTVLDNPSLNDKNTLYNLAKDIYSRR